MSATSATSAMSATSAARRLSALGRIAAAILPVATGLALVATPVAASAAPAGGCSASTCIQDLQTQAGGLDVTQTFETVAPTTDRLDLYNGGYLVTTASDPRLRTTHVLHTSAALQPNTTYFWQLTETRRNGKTVQRTGSVTTLHRQVDVFFSTDTVTDDSDLFSDGDFKTWAKAGPTTIVPAIMPSDITDGQTVLMTSLIRVRDAGNTTPVAVEMLDNDCVISVFPPVSCPFPTNPSWGQGSNTLWDWSTASATLATTTATNGPVTMQFGVDAAPGFVIKGWYSVSFVS